MNSRNNMKLIMENWRQFVDDITDEDISAINESYVYLKKNKKQLAESKNNNPYHRKIKFSEFTHLLENNKISFYTAERMILETMEIDGRALNKELQKEALSDVTAAVKGAATSAVGAVKTAAGKVAGAISGIWQKIKQNVLKGIFSLFSMAGNVISSMSWDLLKTKPFKKVADFTLKWQIKIYQFFTDPKVKKVVGVLLAIAVVLIVCAMIAGLIHSAQAAAKIAQLCAGNTDAGDMNEALLLEVGGVCGIVGNTSPEQAAQMVLKDQDCTKEFLGSIAKANENLQSNYQLDSTQASTVANGKEILNVNQASWARLSDHTTTDIVKVAEQLDWLKNGKYNPQMAKTIISDDSNTLSVFKTLLQKYQSMKSQDPNIGSTLQDIGSRTQIFNVSKIESVFESLQKQDASGYFEQITHKISTLGSNTIKVAPK